MSPPLPTVLKGFLPQALCGPQGALESATPPKQPAPQRPPGAGGPGGRGTPGPIPNPEVKPASAEGTAGATLWETRAPPAPGARCAGSGRGGANIGTWEGGPFGVLFSFTEAFPRPAKADRPPTSPCGSVDGLLRSGANRPRRAVPDGVFRSAVGAGPPSDVASLKRRCADPRGGCGPGSPRVGRGLCIWGSLGSHPPC